MKIVLEKLSWGLAIHRMSQADRIPDAVWTSPFHSVTRTDSELSIVCDERISVPNAKTERGWRCLRVVGQLDFSLTGILASLSRPLAEAKIGIFALSTFDTDYLLIKEENFAEAVRALERAGFSYL